jgi:ankyrin repeat protein
MSKWKASLGLVVLVIIVAGFIQMVTAFKSAPPLPPLVQAARDGDVEAIRKMREMGVDPNDTHRARGWTPLIHAVHKGQHAAVRALLEAGADVNQTTGKQQTALMLAGAYGDTRIVQTLLDAGADPYAVKDGLTALDFAMLGSADTDHFTVFECQYETVALLRRRAPEVDPRGAFFDRTLLFVKPCRY